MSKTIMPKIDASQLTGDALSVAREIAKRDGTLKTARPKNASGDAQYVWRMVVFTVSMHGPHQCMPCMADFYVDGTYCPDLPLTGENRYDNRRAACKRLDGIVDQIIATVPVSQWHGACRWYKAFYGA